MPTKTDRPAKTGPQRLMAALRRRVRDEAARDHSSFLDNLSDMYGPLDMIDIPKVAHGRAGFAQDTARIRSYFSAATSVIDGAPKK